MFEIGWIAATQGLAFAGWMLAASIPHMQLEWRVLATCSLPGIVIGLVAYGNLTVAMAVGDGGWRVIMSVVSCGLAMLAGIISLPLAFWLEQACGHRAR